MKMSKIATAVEKLERVINSCETNEHCLSAKKMVINFSGIFKGELSDIVVWHFTKGIELKEFELKNVNTI